MKSRDGHARVVLGRVAGVYGVKGWVRIFSETVPREGILGYSPWLLGVETSSFRVAEGKRHGKGIIARLEGCDDRDRAAQLVGREISVPRDRLPPPSPDEFYWIDLEGLSVATTAGVDLGRVDHLFSTGANDVLVVKGDRERLLPFVWGDVVKDVDFDAGRIEVDWDPDF
ncbi:ribosome maturation factor RimM [Imhoffiella purpurea]|uniref:Ribosome maturation factor RimM n=1 Tax=Imhoffiella purpurea TaxID=1249627 RepID=W9V9X6_9GAMM|nr:ribosome maturation factor RimM [Imhoffiella purpurea]EXJ13711.1 16S rRNA processing protein RimM [Imhoffiella purpurea]